MKTGVMQVKWMMTGLFLLGIVFSSWAQSTRDVMGPPKPPAPKYQAAKKKQGFLFFGKTKKQPNEVEQFRARMEANARKKYKESKKYDKPQYTDPMYFGHKRPPKKRPPGKRKFCKECEMWH